jgi:hypothetical protein
MKRFDQNRMVITHQKEKLMFEIEDKIDHRINQLFI